MLRNELQKFVNLTWQERLLLFEATCVLAVVRSAMLLFPFKKIAACLGDVNSETDYETTQQANDLAISIGWAVSAMARRVPWESRCLVKSISGLWMLSRRGVSGTVYFGVAPAANRKFNAHAWLRAGNSIVTGAGGHEGFRIITSFARSRV